MAAPQIRELRRARSGQSLGVQNRRRDLGLHSYPRRVHAVMPQAFYILFGAALTVAVSLAAGRILLRSLSIRLYREEEHPLAFVTGAACLSLMTFLLCAIGAARKGVFLAIGLVVLGL